MAEEQAFLKMELPVKALRIAEEAHANQVDKSGEPYVSHPKRVAFYATTIGRIVFPNLNVEHLASTALLHDVLEDCENWTRERLLASGIPGEVVDAVETLTHTKSESRADYLQRIIAAGELAIVVKAADLADNSDPERLAKLSEDVRIRLQEKYKPDLETIRGALFEAAVAHAARRGN